MEPHKVASKDVKNLRVLKVQAQGGKCDLCGLPILETDMVHLDHDHKTGMVRGALHSGCNLMLGFVDGYRGNQLKSKAAWLQGAWRYLQKHVEHPSNLIHPTHFTPEEKRERAKLKAQRKRSKLRKSK